MSATTQRRLLDQERRGVAGDQLPVGDDRGQSDPGGDLLDDLGGHRGSAAAAAATARSYTKFLNQSVVRPVAGR